MEEKSKKSKRVLKPQIRDAEKRGRKTYSTYGDRMSDEGNKVDVDLKRALGKIEAKKSLGQHFLNNARVPKLMADAGNVGNGDTVLEIGPGTGVLTRELLARGARASLQSRLMHAQSYRSKSHLNPKSLVKT